MCSLIQRSVVKPWHKKPSATSPATWVIASPTPASRTFGLPYGWGDGANMGGISVCW